MPPWSLCVSRAASSAMKISPWSSRIIRLILAFLHPLESQHSTGADRKARRQHGCPLTAAFHLSPTFSSEYFQGLPSRRTRKMGDSGLNERQPARRPQNQRGKIKAKPSLGEHFKERAQNGQVAAAIAGVGVNTISCRFVLHKEKRRRGTSPPLEPFLVLDCLCQFSVDRARWVTASGRWFKLWIWLYPSFTRLVPCTHTFSEPCSLFPQTHTHTSG